MTLKRTLHCTLIFIALFTSSCGLLGGSESQSNTSQQTNSGSAAESASPIQNRIDFDGAAQVLREASGRLTAPNREAATVKPVKQQISQAIEKIGADEKQIEERCVDCSNEIKDKINEAVRRLDDISRELGKDADKIADLGESTRRGLSKRLTDEAEALTRLKVPSPTPNQTSKSTASPVEAETNSDESSWLGLLLLAAKILAALVGLILIVSALMYLWKRAWKTVEVNVGQVLAAHLAATREAQPDYAPKLAALSSSQAEMSNRLTELDSEVRSLARLVRESVSARRHDRDSSHRGLNYQSHFEDIPAKDEPEFPVSAVDYLGKMNRFTIVVKPDFQNGILVNDPDGTGELVLIRDSRFPDGKQPLFVVPSATQFHTKQDFYTYYEKYYDCVRPSAGDVWIIGPAVVEKVAGGWQLREKGMLEIR